MGIAIDSRSCRKKVELELIQTKIEVKNQEAREILSLDLELELRNTNPNDTEANAAGRSVRACVARKSKS
jgi:hypothetical protein